MPEPLAVMAITQRHDGREPLIANIAEMIASEVEVAKAAFPAVESGAHLTTAISSVSTALVMAAAAEMAKLEYDGRNAVLAVGSGFGLAICGCNAFERGELVNALRRGILHALMQIDASVSEAAAAPKN